MKTAKRALNRKTPGKDAGRTRENRTRNAHCPPEHFGGQCFAFLHGSGALLRAARQPARLPEPMERHAARERHRREFCAALPHGMPPGFITWERKEECRMNPYDKEKTREIWKRVLGEPEPPKPTAWLERQLAETETAV